MAVLVALLTTAVACSPGAGHPAGAVPGSTSASAAASGSVRAVSPVGIADVQREALAWAAEHQVVAGPDGLVRIDTGVAWEPAVVWQAARDGSLCLADSTGFGVSLSCEKAEDIAAMPSPGLRAVFGAAPNRSTDRYRLLFLSAGEEVLTLTCGAEAVPARKVVDVGAAGGARTLWWADVAHPVGGTYRVEVRRSGGPAVEEFKVPAPGPASC